MLVVEDDKLTQSIDRYTLEHLEANPKFANNGSEAIELIKTKEFDLILMDIYMPVQDGLDTTRWIRDLDDDYFKNVPIFALTSFPNHEHTEEILEAGMNEHLVKPLNIEDFCMKLIKYKFKRH